MKKTLLILSSITYAMKAQDVLRKYGYRTEIKKVTQLKITHGCGYGLIIFRNVDQAIKILSKHNIKVLQIINMEGKT